MSPLLTVPQVATYLGITRKGVYGLVEAKRIPFVRLGRIVRFVEADVVAWVRENRVSPQEK